MMIMLVRTFDLSTGALARFSPRILRKGRTGRGVVLLGDLTDFYATSPTIVDLIDCILIEIPTQDGERRVYLSAASYGKHDCTLEPMLPEQEETAQQWIAEGGPLDLTDAVPPHTWDLPVAELQRRRELIRAFLTNEKTRPGDEPGRA